MLQPVFAEDEEPHTYTFDIESIVQDQTANFLFYDASKKIVSDLKSNYVVQPEQANAIVALYDYDEAYRFLGWSINDSEPMLKGNINEGNTTITVDDTCKQFKGIDKKNGEDCTSDVVIKHKKNTTLDKTYIIKPIFVEKDKATYSLTVNVNEETGGTVESSHITSEKWEITAKPYENYIFTGWKINNQDSDEKKSQITVDLTEDTKYTAIFEKKKVEAKLDQDSFNLIRDREGYTLIPTSMYERGYFYINYKVKGNSNLQSNIHYNLYKGTDTTGEKLAEWSEKDTVLVPNQNHISEHIVDPVPDVSQMTLEIMINDNEPVIYTYDVVLEPHKLKDLVYIQTPSDKFLSNVAALDPGPNIYDVATFLDEDTGKRSVYAAALGGVLELQGLEFNYMPGLDLKTGDSEGNAGLVLGIGGTKDHLLAFVQDSEKSGVSTLLSYAIYEYTKELGKWRKVQGSEIIKDSLKPNHLSAYITNKNEVWTDQAHWNGQEWKSHDYNFSTFKKSVNDVAYASSKKGIYFYDNNEWKEINLKNIQMNNAPNLQNVTATGDVIAHIQGQDYKISRDGTVEKLPEAYNQITTNIYNRTSMDSNGNLYAFPSTRKYTAVGTSGYTGNSIYKYDEAQKKWIYQHVDAFTAPNDFTPEHADYLTKKVRPNGVETIYILQDNMNLFVGAGGAIYADFGSSTIKFNSSGGTPVGAITGNVGTDIPMITTPTKAGEYFAGWYSDATLTKPYYFDFMPAKDITLYAKWITSTIDLSKEIDEAVAALEAYAKQFKSYQYEGDNYQKVLAARDAGIKAIKAVTTSKGDITNALNQAKKAIEAVPKKTTVTVAVTMEKFTLGQGYIIEPVLVTVPKYTPASKVITDLLKKKYPEIEQPWKMTGKVEDTFYLSHVYDTDYDYSNFPEYVKKAAAERGGDFTLERKKDWLGEFDFYNMSGWMYAINNKFPGVGAAAWVLEDRQVMRWQYTVFGYGADLNADNSEWGTASLINTARKDDLIWRIAEINAMENKATFLTEGDNQKHYDEAMKVLQVMDTPQKELDRLLQALGGEETEEEVPATMPNEAKVVNDAIKALPTVITLKDKNTIEQIRANYDALDDVMKQWIWKDEVATLTAAEKKIANLLAPIQAVETLINKLPAIAQITLQHESQIMEAYQQYYELTIEQQNYVKNIEQLFSVHAKLQDLKGATTDVAVQNVIKQIDLLPSVSTMTVSDENILNMVKVAYDSLTTQQQQLVTNGSTLQSLLTKMKELKSQAYLVVVKEIDALPTVTHITLAQRTQIKTIREKYLRLSSSDRAQVTNISKLEEAAFHISKIEMNIRFIMEEINQLPAVDAIKMEHESLVITLRKAYEELHKDDQTFVTNIDKLKAVEQRLKELQENNENIPKEFEEGITTSTGIEKAEVDHKQKTLQITATSSELLLSAELLATTMQQKMKKIVIDSEQGKLTIPLTVIKNSLGKNSKVKLNYQQQTKFNMDVTLQEVLSNGIKRDVVVSKGYVTLEIPLANMQPNNKRSFVLLQDGEQGIEAIPHHIGKDTVTVYLKQSKQLIVSQQGVSFADIKGLGSAGDIESLAMRHIVTGNGGKFEPNHSITRAQFAAMIARALNLIPLEETYYPDVKGAWYEDAVQALYEAHITQSPGNFNPGQAITRQQAAAIIYRALHYVDYEADDTRTNKYQDQHKIDQQYTKAIQTLQAEGIMNGKPDGSFAPGSNLTRAQMAQIIHRMLNKVEM